jgi:hypothetical protein
VTDSVLAVAVPLLYVCSVPAGLVAVSSGRSHSFLAVATMEPGGHRSDRSCTAQRAGGREIEEINRSCSQFQPGFRGKMKTRQAQGLDSDGGAPGACQALRDQVGVGSGLTRAWDVTRSFQYLRSPDCVVNW